MAEQRRVGASEAAEAPDPDASVLVISVAAQLSGLHAQTLRQYDRLGIVSPARTSGGGRRYSLRDVARLREVQQLSQEEGINLAGIKRIIELSDRVGELESRLGDLVAELEAARGRAGRGGELVHVPRSTSVVVWRPRRERGDG